jgi:hypothetical protein
MTLVLLLAQRKCHSCEAFGHAWITANRHSIRAQLLLVSYLQ